MPNNFNGPKILSIDIETSPVVAHAWALRKQNIAINQILERPRTICFAAKYLHERKVHFYSEFEHGPDVMFHAAHALLSDAEARTYSPHVVLVDHDNRIAGRSEDPGQVPPEWTAESGLEPSGVPFSEGRGLVQGSAW